MLAYLAVRSGPEKGRQYLLDPARPMHVGRGASCEIMLTDPVSSRFHAVVFYDDGNWHLRDTSSRNGTLVNGQKIKNARLLDQSVVTIGGTDLQLIEPSSDSDHDATHTQVILPEQLTRKSWGNDSDPMLGFAKTEHVMDLYELSLQILKGDSADELIGTALQMLCQRTNASLVGLSSDEGNGRLKHLRTIPEKSKNSLSLPRALTRRVVQGEESLWLNRQDETKLAKPAKISDDWADAIYIPVKTKEDVLGVLSLFNHDRSFTEKHFEFAEAAGRLLALGLSRNIRHHQVLADNERIARNYADSNELIGDGAVMTKLKAKIERVGKANGSVLIRGESGSGKELVARAVHRASPRGKRPMLTVNCAAIPRDLIESQLFGHKKGSFTGAEKDHIGWFEQAHAGTLFLDEIGELTLEGQAKLLRILEGHPFLPVGATEEVLVDVRVIAATNRDLAEFVREKKFREDLFYRLSVFELSVPPLRDRGDDVETLVDHFLDHFKTQHARGQLKLSDEARSRLCEYAWPGNVRQLRNVIDSAVVMADDPQIEVDDLGLRDAGVSSLDTLRIDFWEERLIRKALRRVDNNVPEAAKLLGISRATAYRKITEYDIER